MAVPTWSQFTFLSAAQQAKAEQLSEIGRALQLMDWKPRPGQPVNPPDISGVTYSQVKAAEVFLKELETFLTPAALAVVYIRRKKQAEQLAALEAANP
jgi:ABC-type cobalamin transport system ATPase subunit